MTNVEQELREALLQFMQTTSKRQPEQIGEALNRILQLEQQLSADAPPMLRHYLERRQLPEGTGFSQFRARPRQKHRSAGIDKFRQEHSCRGAILRVVFTKTGARFGFFGFCEAIINCDQKREHHQGDQRRPVYEAADEEKKEAGVLWMADIAIEAGDDEFALCAIDPPPACQCEDPRRGKDNKQLTDYACGDRAFVPESEKIGPGVPVEMVAGVFGASR